MVDVLTEGSELYTFHSSRIEYLGEMLGFKKGDVPAQEETET